MAEHVELGYATTIHRAQGMTVDHAHVLVHPGMTRQALYVALTRGRASNHAYVAVDAIDPTRPHPPDVGETPTGRQILQRILATDGAELSATKTMRQRQNDAASLATLAPIRNTLAAAAARDRWQAVLPRCGLTAEQATSAINSPAAGALFAALDAGADLGYPMPRVLRGLVGARPLGNAGDPVRDLAAVLHARVSEWLQTIETAQTAGRADVDALLGRQRADSPDDPGLRRALRDVDALIDARVDDLLQRQDTAWSEALGPPPDDPNDRMGWEPHARTIAAYRDLATPTGSRSHDDASDRRRRLLLQQAMVEGRRATDLYRDGISPP